VTMPGGAVGGVRVHVARALLCLLLGAQCVAAPVILVGEGRANVLICAPPEVLNAPDRDGDWGIETDLRPVAQRQRLRDSVRDLARCLQKMSGAQIEMLAGAPPNGEKRVPILIGELAAQRFGGPKKQAPFAQGFRLVVSPEAVGLIGESDLATSYAIYEVLHRLGCRWYMPSELGECLPQQRTIVLESTDESLAPATTYRSLWEVDEDYKRRNRMGGLYLSASHALDSYVSPDLLKQHPEWVAVVGGAPHPPTLKWTVPGVADAIADTVLASLDRGTYKYTVSLSPEDGMAWDESEDPKFDAGDFEPTLNSPSVTDRLMVLTNRVASKVTAKYPDVLFGQIIYCNYTRPPLREKLHPSIVPVIAPISYSRNHPITDQGEPNNADLRRIYEQWGKLSKQWGVYFYVYNLAEQSTPNPMIARMSIDVPFVINHGCRFFCPESSSTFEASMHGLYLATRLAWDAAQDPKAIIDELNLRFYGPAAAEMGAYWALADECWAGTPEYSGAGFGHHRRFTPERLAKMREVMNAALTKARGGIEHDRVAMANESLILLEQYMKMRRDLIEGRWETLDFDAEKWVERQHAMAERYRAQCAFSARTYGAGGVWGNNNGVDFFEAFWKPAYDDASRLANHWQVLTPQPLRQWKYQPDRERKGEAQGWPKLEFDDLAWKTTDVGVETWSSIGLHNYFGLMWYRASVAIPKGDPTRKTFLWVGSFDGTLKVFVNGQPVPFIARDGKREESVTGFARPASFDISGVIRADAENQITILCDRTSPNEIGVGGLLAPVAIYREQ